MASPRSGPKSPRWRWRRAAVPAILGADRHVGVRVDVRAAVGGAHHQLAHVAQPGVVERAPGPVARRPQALRRAVGEHLEAGVAGEDRHAREAVARQAQDAALADQRVRGQHLLRARHRGQALQGGRQQRLGLLARARERGADALERVAGLALGALARRPPRLDPLGEHVDHRLEERERVGGLHHVGLGPAALLVHQHELLDLLAQRGVGVLLAQPVGHDLARSAPGASGCTPGRPRTRPSPSRRRGRGRRARRRGSRRRSAPPRSPRARSRAPSRACAACGESADARRPSRRVARSTSSALMPSPGGTAARRARRPRWPTRCPAARRGAPRAARRARPGGAGRRHPWSGARPPRR